LTACIKRLFICGEEPLEEKAKVWTNALLELPVMASCNKFQRLVTPVQLIALPPIALGSP
jgi:hypothetical protein